MEFEAVLKSFATIHSEFGGVLDTFLLTLTRVLAFVFFAPIFNRKDIVFNIKLSIAIFLSASLIWIIPVDAHGSFAKDNTGIFFLQVGMNAMIGTLLGFIADLILQSVYCAGDIINNQVGLSSAMFFDPASRKQSALMETLFIYITAVVFMYADGMHWLILALKRSFDVFPLYSLNQPIMQTINLSYLVGLSGHTLLIATQLAAPVMVVTMAVDVMLAVVNRTAQQIPVYQISSAVKPVIGILVMIVTLPLFLNVMMHYLQDYSKIF
ncbi:MAG: flagellar biosynthetic protein FliR [Cyanobacteria bacterium]|nr:flagellar biosynthetic protein FliR [Cyanobacteriota bacterium]